MQISLRAYNQIIEDLLENDQIDEVIAHCRHILQEFPNHLETLRILGKASLDHGNLEHSSAAFTQVLRSLPSDFVSNLGISFIHQTQGDIAGAIWFLERVFESNPNNVMVQDELKKLMTTRDGKVPDRLNKTDAILAQIYANGGEYLRAIELITTVIADDPKRVDMKTLLARIYSDMNEPSRALDACKECFKDSPYNFEALRVALKLAERTGATDQVEAWRERMLAVDPYAIDPATKLLVGDRPLPDDVVMLDKLEWMPTNITPDDVETTAPREGLGGDDGPTSEAKEQTPRDSSTEPIVEIPVEQDTPQWLRELLSDAKGGTGNQKFDREAGDNMPDWVRDLPPETAPGSTEDKGLLPSERRKPEPLAETRQEDDQRPSNAMPIIDLSDDMEAEAFTPKLSNDWKPIPVEREDPIEALAATRRSTRVWYTEREVVIPEPVPDPLDTMSSTQPTTPVTPNTPADSAFATESLPTDPITPTDWREDLDLDWIGEPREEPEDEEPARALITEEGEEPPVMIDLLIDPNELDWLGDLSKPENADGMDWLGDISHPVEATIKNPAAQMEQIGLAAGALPDMPNVLLPEGSMLPKEPIETIPQNAIEESHDPATMGILSEDIRSTENNTDGMDSGDDSAGEDFYTSLQNPPSRSEFTRNEIDEDRSLVGSFGEQYAEPIEEILPESVDSPVTTDLGSPDEPNDELEIEASDEPIETIVPEDQIPTGIAPSTVADELPDGSTSTMPEDEPEIYDEPTEVFTNEGKAAVEILEPSPAVGQQADSKLDDEPVPTEDIQADSSDLLFEDEDDLLYDEPDFPNVDEGSEEEEDEQTMPEPVAAAPEGDEAEDDEFIELEPSEEAREEQFIGSAFDRGKRYLENGQLEKGLSEFSDLIKYERMLDLILPIMVEVVTQNSSSKRALRVLGDAYFNADKLDEALAAYAKADDMPDDAANKADDEEI